MRSVRPLLVLLAAALVLTACGGAEMGGAGGVPAPGEQELPPEAEEGDVAPPLPEATDPDGPHFAEPEMREPHPDPVDVAPAEWEAAEAVDETTLRLTYWTGVEPCAVLSHVEVEETESSVTLTLHTGRAASSDDAACIMIAIYAGVDVELDAPLGDREVLDGSVGVG